MLLRSRRFAPLFVTQFLGAFNDNLYKNALVLLVLFQGFGAVTASGLVVNLAAAVFILPFFLLSASAGQWVDSTDKTRVARVAKWLEVFIAGCGAVALLGGSLALALLALALLGAQSALFGPVKYGVLPQHLRPDELLAGNAWIEAGTFFAILLGTLVAGLLIAAGQGVELVAALVLVVALAGVVVVHLMPPAPSAVSSPAVDLQLLRATCTVLGWARGQALWRPLLGISWFWAFGATVLTQLPLLVREQLAGDAAVVSSLLAVFTCGVGVGSWLAAAVLKRDPQAPVVAAAALDMGLLTGVLVWLAAMVPEGLPLRGPVAFWSDPLTFGIGVCLFGLAAAGGAYCVPLYTAVQRLAPEQRRGQAIAANNIVNSAAMVLAALTGMLVFAVGGTVGQLLALAALLNLPVAWWVWRRRPERTAAL